MPVWHESTRDAVKAGRLVLLGVTQEQHADRCRLFAQWKGFGWPILHDPINVLRSSAVPIVVAIDEHGITRAIGPRPETFAAEFLDREFADDAPALPPTSTARPDPVALRREAESNPSADAWRALGDALTIWEPASRIDEAIEAYSRALALDPVDKNARFRLGVAQRMRYESDRRRPGDFQAAVDSWGQALALDPNQYIWRRRIEQYGPRLSKPYPFYDWVDQARTEITARGEEPVPLAIAPQGSEIAAPSREFPVEDESVAEPDPNERIFKDSNRFIEAEVVVVPARVRSDQAARVHLGFRPNPARQSHWNNESTPLRVWVAGAEGWTIAPRLLVASQGPAPESDEVRRLDFEVKPPPGTRGKTRLAAYALYNTCEETGGRCLYLRQDLAIEIEVVP